MSWTLLFVAGLFEVGWAIGLKYTDGFTKPAATIMVLLALIASMALLGLAVREIPIGTAYAVWTGIGVIGTVIGGMILFDESRDWLRLACVGMILLGIVGLKLQHASADDPPQLADQILLDQ